MKGLNNFLLLVNENWTSILVFIGVVIALYKKVKAYLTTSTDEKVAIAKKAIEERVKKYIADAEVNWDEYTKAGSVKRAEVLDTIYKEYPILSKIVNQDEIVEWIDELINGSLKEIEEIVK